MPVYCINGLGLAGLVVLVIAGWLGALYTGYSAWREDEEDKRSQD